MTRDRCVYIAFLAAIALTACLAPPVPLTALISDLAVLSMMTLYFSAVRSGRSERFLWAAELAEFALKVTFAALCAQSGSVLLHAAALITDRFFEKCIVSFRDTYAEHSYTDL